TIIPYIVREDLLQDTLELLCIEVRKPKSKPVLISTWYRPPSAKIELFQKFENFLKLIDNEDKDIIITGYLNCNFIEHTQNQATSKLIDIIYIFQLQQHIQTPTSTRTTYNSSSLVDLILTHIDDDKTLEAGVVHRRISDHSLVYICRKISIPKELPKIVFTRQFKNYNSHQFKEELSYYTNLDSTSNDPNVLWNEFKNNFLTIAEKHAPVRQRRVK
ncbi:RNA-directed DNA polymerase from transposon BS, partial [Paramuricea clavata]